MVREHRCLWRRPGHDHCRPVRRLHERFRHLCPPLSKGLLRGAILQSGGGLLRHEEVPPKEEITQTSQKLMEHLGVSTIEELRAGSFPPDSWDAAAVQGQDLSWRPHVDGWLPATTDALAEAGAIHDIPYMIGSTGNDIGDGSCSRKAAPAGVKTAEAGENARLVLLFRPEAARRQRRGVPLLRAVV